MAQLGQKKTLPDDEGQEGFRAETARTEESCQGTWPRTTIAHHSSLDLL